MADRAEAHFAEHIEPDCGAGEPIDGVRDPRRGVAVVPGARGAAADPVVGPGHQLLAALPDEHDVVDECWTGIAIPGVLSFNFLGDALRDALEAQFRRRA